MLGGKGRRIMAKVINSFWFPPLMLFIHQGYWSHQSLKHHRARPLTDAPIFWLYLLRDASSLFYAKNFQLVMMVWRLLMTIAIFWWRTMEIITATLMFAGEDMIDFEHWLVLFSEASVTLWGATWPAYTARRRMILSPTWSSHMVHTTGLLRGWALAVSTATLLSGMIRRRGTTQTGDQVLIFPIFAALATDLSTLREGLN